ncbi:MAG: hypothetical protein P8M34_08010 [Saprospiraceae bacterium]|nr:hypothetical protein [Saprospiraceae bacterium]
MKKKENITEKALKVTREIKVFLFLFFAVIVSGSVKSQICPIIDTNNTTVTHVCAPGAATGAIDLAVLDTSVVYSFVWSNVALPSFNETTEDLASLVAGTYSDSYR